MQLLKEFSIGQPDPFILEADGKYYIYTTGFYGVQAYSADDLFGKWQYHGIVFQKDHYHEYWAPSVIAIDGVYYMYVSFEYLEDRPDVSGHMQSMFVATSTSPLGPFVCKRHLLAPFAIDAHAVRNESGLFLFYSTNTYEGERIGTCIVADRLLDPFTLEGKPVPMVLPTLDEEIYQRDRFRPGQHWHTLEGAFYFQKDGWHYLMYSGNCFEAETYYIGYARAKTDETDLTKIHFEKYPDSHTYHPVLSRNEWEEGTGHHSVILYKGEYYAVYHARSREDRNLTGETRRACICKLSVQDGVITAQRYPDKV